MKVFTFLAFALILSALPALADDLSYDDPGMHFKAPDGWQRVPIPAGARDDAPAAAFTFTHGQDVTKSVIITIADYDGTLADFAATKTQAMRSADSEDTVIFIDKRMPTKTTNGMPAMEIVWTQTPSNSIQTKNYDYLMIDGKRSIDVRLTGKSNELGDDDAAAIFANLYVVAFPRARPT